MTIRTRPARPVRPPELRFLMVDEYLEDLVSARALATAFELGLVDRLLEAGGTSVTDLEDRLPSHPRALPFLLEMLAANEVLRDENGLVDLTPDFLEALEFRDLLEMKLTFNDLVLEDYHRQFTSLVCRPGEFQDTSRIFELFRYDRCFDPTPENLEFTRRWVFLTTTLTRYEAGVLLARHDFSAHHRMLDIGGNSGELARRIVEAHPGIVARVADLPLVCMVGARHVGSSPAAGRLSFHPGDALTGELPEENDLVVFKSFLHDWPARDLPRFLERAHRSLAPGGTVMIFERAPIEIRGKIPPYSMIYSLLFFHSYRPAAAYRAALEAAGFSRIETRRVEIEMPFHLITATR